MSSDYHMAKVLQEQFQVEYETEKSADKLIYKKPTKQDLNSSKCLVDPSWEVIDPTPDIHILFMAFSERFFWNKLATVCVSWSKRMTSCAGICSYQGRGGMCSITLSEPLLKLRPRRDLVETLLHEMIHAFLFVTHNNRDRDGHGPEFHKHMYRINAEAGTNITVYHDFHDEVRLYKQHWWKCNGPCQNRKPYFGLVKRAMNRAPGPTDIWWAEHSRSCGGEFIKIKEPEKKKSSKSEKPAKNKPETITKPLPDIRKHFNPTEQKSMILTGSTSKQPKKEVTPIITINDLISPVKNKSPQKNNKHVFGFPNTSGRTLSDSKVPPKDYSVVRNHWLNKFSSSISYSVNETRATSTSKSQSSSKKSPSNSDDLLSTSNRFGESKSSNERHSSSNGLKRSSNEFLVSVSPKIPKLCLDLTSADPSLVQCPVCSRAIANEELNSHLDDYLNKTKLCITCNKEVPDSEYQEHITDCCDKNGEEKSQENEKTANQLPNSSSFVKKTPSTSIKFEQCNVCDIPIESGVFVAHLQKCLENMYQNLEEKFTGKNSKCPVCDKDVRESEMSDHLENCKDLSDVFEDDSSIPIEEVVEEYNCPICTKLVNIEQMNSHIDVCLNIVDR